MDFNSTAINTLEVLFERLEENRNFDHLEIDFLDEILYITSEQNEEYVINKHSASKQIWVSSPLTGAHYFSYNSLQKLWIDKYNKELISFIENELKLINS